MLREDLNAARDLLIATIGRNVAWGIIDGALYVNGPILERARMARLGLHGAASPASLGHRPVLTITGVGLVAVAIALGG